MKTRVKLLFLAIVAVLAVSCGQRGDAGYDPKADANAQLDAALEAAQQRGKNALVQVGGSWCPWCVRLHRLFESDSELRTRLREDYVWVQVYYGRDNENASALSRLGDLKGYGYPVLVVVSPTGQVLHVQNTGELEEGEGYNREKVLSFLQQYKDVPAAEGAEAQASDAVAEEGVAQPSGAQSEPVDATGVEEE